MITGIERKIRVNFVKLTESFVEGAGDIKCKARIQLIAELAPKDVIKSIPDIGDAVSALVDAAKDAEEGEVCVDKISSKRSKKLHSYTLVQLFSDVDNTPVSFVGATALGLKVRVVSGDSIVCTWEVDTTLYLRDVETLAGMIGEDYDVRMSTKECQQELFNEDGEAATG